ncbi:MAG: site-2 protease family protein [Oscillospiraceae bacterium]|nr:site-2 protease family protein [Oscillospiraceae bacterium]
MLRDLLSGNVDQSTIIQLLAELVIIFLILPLHEMAHAWTAYKLGDDTASIQGRMTLNPIAHLDPIGALLMLTTGFGWAKPVPINPRRFNRKHSMRFGIAITALAGPVSNLIAALIGMVIYRFYLISDFYTSLTGGYYIRWGYVLSGHANDTQMLIKMFLEFFISVNIGLAVFNLIPIPPLDGSKVIGYFTPEKFDRWIYQNNQIVRIVFLIVLFSGLLSEPMGWLSDQIRDMFLAITDWIPKVFG